MVTLKMEIFRLFSQVLSRWNLENVKVNVMELARRYLIRADISMGQNASASAESQGHVVLPQDSLVRLLLNIDEMQPKLMRSLLTRLTEAAGRQRSPKVRLESIVDH